MTKGTRSKSLWVPVSVIIIHLCHGNSASAGASAGAVASVIFES